MPVEVTAAEVRPREQVGNHSLSAPTQKVLMETLTQVRAMAGKPVKEDDGQSEKRTQLRIAVSAAVQIVWPGAGQAEEANLQDISWGGAAIRVSEVRGVEGDVVSITLPTTQKGEITLDATIERTWQIDDAHGVAVRFASLDPRDEEKLESLLESLVQNGDDSGKRSHARLTQRLDLEFDDADDLQATLEDVSAGGLGITVPQPLAIGQSFQTVIGTVDGANELKLRARVVHQEPVQVGNMDVYHVGLEFEHPTEHVDVCVQQFLSQLTTIRQAPVP